MHDTFDLSQFQELREACIDASSLIYMSTIGCLEKLQREVILYSLSEILHEAGTPDDGLRLVVCREDAPSNDQKLLNCAREYALPLISEDKKLLLHAKRAGLLHYNALMMLNFLFFKHALDSGEYERCYRRLQDCARYSDAVWQYGAQVRDVIQELLDRSKLVDE